MVHHCIIILFSFNICNFTAHHHHTVTNNTTPLMINNFLVPAQTSNVNQTLQSNAQILPTLLSSSTSSISVSTISTSSSTQTTTGTSTQTTTGTSTQTTTSTSTQTTTNTSTQTTTTTNVSKTNLTLTNLFTNPLAVLILVLALIGVVLFVTV